MPDSKAERGPLFLRAVDFKLGQAAIVSGDQVLAMRHLKEALIERRALLMKSPEYHQVLTDIAENLMVMAKTTEVPAERLGWLQEAKAILLDRKKRGRAGRE